MNVSNQWKDICWSYPSKMFPKTLSTNPFYKLFSVVHSYFQWMCLVIDRIYDDRIPRKCSHKLRKFAGKGKPENANIYYPMIHWKLLWTTLKSLCLIIERIYDDRIPRKCAWMRDERICDDRIPPKCPQKICEKPETWQCEYPPSHLQSFQCGTKLLSMYISNRIWWLYLPSMFPKT